jgi:hypothetical protein
MKRTIAIMLALLLVLPALPATAADENILAHDWARPNIELALFYDIVPDILTGADYREPTTRREYVHLAVKFFDYLSDTPVSELIESGELEVDYDRFSDTDDPIVAIGAALGITTGTTGGRFDPDMEFRREQAAVMTHRLLTALDWAGPGNGRTEPFSDIDLAGDWAAPSIAFAALHRVMTGIGGDIFDPLGTFTRQQSVTVFSNLVRIALTGICFVDCSEQCLICEGYVFTSESDIMRILIPIPNDDNVRYIHDQIAELLLWKLVDYIRIEISGNGADVFINYPEIHPALRFDLLFSFSTGEPSWDMFYYQSNEEGFKYLYGNNYHIPASGDVHFHVDAPIEGFISISFNLQLAGNSLVDNNISVFVRPDIITSFNASVYIRDGVAAPGMEARGWPADAPLCPEKLAALEPNRIGEQLINNSQIIVR